MKIYTKTGDKGKTSLLSGERLPKYHIRVEAYGNIDELTSFVGLLRSLDIDEDIKSQLVEIQRRLFDIAGLLACDKGKLTDKLRKISTSDVEFLEKKIDYFTSKLPPLKAFVLPGGQYEVSICHICRTVCRRAERSVVKLADTEEIDNNIIVYLNRLSDYFFVLSRYIAKSKNFEQIKI